MHPELKKLCKQTVTRYAYITRDDHNDYVWTTTVTDQDVVLTGTTAVVLHVYLDSDNVVIKSTDGLTTYTLNTDYTVNYTTGAIARTAGSTIPSGGTVHATYGYYTTVTTFLARVENVNKLLRGKDGQEVVSSCQIYCDYDTVIELKDKITCSDFDVPFPEILKIDSNPDETGAIDHFVIYTR
jgi:hypothetical protein